MNEQQRVLLPFFSELRGQRLLLQMPHVEEADLYFAAINESRERLNVWDNDHGFDRYQSVDNVRVWLRRETAHWLLREHFQMGIWDLPGQRLLGQMMLSPHNWSVPSFEIGYWLRTSAEGNGYMSEAVQLLLDYVFDQLGTQRVTLRIDERNKASQTVTRRLHFNYEGTLRNVERGYDNAILCNMMIWSLIPSDRAVLLSDRADLS